MSHKQAAVVFGLALACFLRPLGASAQPDDPLPTIPSGTIIRVQMKSRLNSRSSYPGQTFRAVSSDPVYQGSEILLPAGIEIEGHVTTVEPARRASRSGMIGVTIDYLRLSDGTRVAIDAELSSFDSDPHRELDDEGRIKGSGTGKRTVGFIGGTAGAGALIGLLRGGGKGAAIGSASGAIIGTIAVLAMKGNEADVRPGTVFGVKLLRDVRMATPVKNHDLPAGRVLTSPAMIRAAQQALVNRGYDPGPVDGAMGARTSDALRDFQHDSGLRESGVLDEETALALELDETDLHQPVSNSNGNTGGSTSGPSNRDSNGASNSSNGVGVLARVLTATGQRQEDGSIRVSIATEQPADGERLAANHEVREEKLEISVRTEPGDHSPDPSSDGRLDVVVFEGVALVDTVVVHGSSGDLLLGVDRFDLHISDRVESQANKMLEEYRKQLGITDKDGITVFNSNHVYSEDEIELLFQLENFANAARLYARLNHAVRSSAGIRGGVSSLLSQFRSVEAQIGLVKVSSAVTPGYQSIRSDLATIASAYRMNF